eukprot:gene18519-20377_t
MPRISENAELENSDAEPTDVKKLSEEKSHRSGKKMSHLKYKILKGATVNDCLDLQCYAGHSPTIVALEDGGLLYSFFSHREEENAHAFTCKWYLSSVNKLASFHGDFPVNETDASDSEEPDRANEDMAFVPAEKICTECNTELVESENVQLPAEYDKSEPDYVNCKSFWDEVVGSVLMQGFAKNVPVLQPDLLRWAPFIGERSCKGSLLINSEHKKVRQEDGELESDCREVTEERLLELLQQSNIKEIVAFAKSMGIFTKGSKLDILMQIKEKISKDHQSFKKAFEKLSRHSGGITTASCPHGVVYAMKFLMAIIEVLASFLRMTACLLHLNKKHRCSESWFHECNATKPKEIRRRITHVPQLNGLINTQREGQLNSSIRKDTRFLNQMKPINHIYLFCCILEIRNDKINAKAVHQLQSMSLRLVVYDGNGRAQLDPSKKLSSMKVKGKTLKKRQAAEMKKTSRRSEQMYMTILENMTRTVF